MANTVFVSVAALLFVFCVSTAEGKKPGDNCTVATDCDYFGKACTNGTCQCSGQYIVQGETCVAKVNETCQTSNSEPGCVTNAECKGTPKKCECKEDYKANEDRTACTENGATLMTVSLMLTIVGIVMSRLI